MLTAPSAPNSPGSSLRIGIDALAWNRKTGYGRFCREIVSALLRLPGSRSFTLLMEADARAPAGADVIRVPPGRIGLAWTIARTPVDLWFFPSPLHFVPVLRRVPVVVAVHDTIPWSYPRLIFPSYRKRLAWDVKLRLAVRQASHVVTVSGYARQSVARHFRIAESAISVVHGAPAAIFQPVPDKSKLDKISELLGIPPQSRVILYHGALAPHKNLLALARVFVRLCRELSFRDLYLVLVGAPDESNPKDFHALQRTCEGIGRVRFPGVLDDGSLVLALNRATVAVLPSLEEGFGLGGLEAAACGTPLIATRRSALPEVLGDAAVYFEPHDENALYSHLSELLADPVRRLVMRRQGLERAAVLSWETGAARLMEVFEALAARPGERR